MAGLIFEDEDGNILWEWPTGEYQPPGTLVTEEDGARYLVISTCIDRPAGHPDVIYRMRLQPRS